MLLQAAKLVGAGRASVGLAGAGVGKVVGIQYDPNRTGREERKKRKGKKGHRCEKKREREYQKGKETE